MTIRRWIGLGFFAMLGNANLSIAQQKPAANGSAWWENDAPAPVVSKELTPGLFKRFRSIFDDSPPKPTASNSNHPMNRSERVVLPQRQEPGVTSAAAAAKKDAVDAKNRADAIRYLATLDCRYHPEGEASLIATLRTDRVESVRYEAAMALANGCCCTRKALEAIEVCVSGSERDGNPAECSARVRDAASAAITKCLSRLQEATPNAETTKNDADLLERARQTAIAHGTKKNNDITPVAVPPIVGPSNQREPERLAGPILAAKPIEPTPAPRKPLFSFMRSKTPPVLTATSVKKAPAIDATPEPPLAETPIASLPVAEAPPVTPLPQEVVPASSTQPAAEKPKERPLPPLISPSGSILDAPPPLKVSTTPIPLPIRTKPTLEVIAPESTSVEAASKTETITPPLATVEAAPTKGVIAPVPPIDPTPAVTATVVKENPSVSMKTDKTLSTEDAIGNLIEVLNYGATPNERHQALRGLAFHDWRKNPQVVAGLVKTARLDPDRAVRVNAIRHMAALKMDLPYVYIHLRFMQKDADEWVRLEAGTALTRLQAVK